jgi:hypothetical protein
MALIYQATLTPSKLALLTDWLPSRPWSGGPARLAQPLTQLGAYRFDDPAGEVGMESFLLAAADGTILHVPLTYRSAPPAGAQDHLVGTTEHSVLGRRWVYDGCADPIWVTALAQTVLGATVQAEELVNKNGQLEPRQPTATVIGSATTDPEIAGLGTGIGAVTSQDDDMTTLVRTDTLELVVVRVVGAEVPAPHLLTGRWPGGGPAALAGLRVL